MIKNNKIQNKYKMLNNNRIIKTIKHKLMMIIKKIKKKKLKSKKLIKLM